MHTVAATSGATAQTVSVEKVKVPMRDVRGADLYSVRGSAGIASQGHIVIIFGSGNGAALEETKESARQAIANGLPVRGILVSDAYPSDTIEIWAGTNRYAAEVAPFNNLKTRLDNTLPGAATHAAENLEIFKREEMAANNAKLTPAALQ